MATAPEIKYRVTIHYQEGRRRFYAEDLGNGVLLKMVQIPADTFTMGSPEDESERLDWEGPQHQVTLGDFFMGMYPVTQEQYEIVMGDNPSRFKGKNRPVEQVSWHQAVEFCARLAKQTDRPYRLPTEAEWEYACRAGTQTPFHFGETITTDLANYHGTNEKYGAYGRGPKGSDRHETTEVGSFPANAWGLFDLHGNVWEWCADHWHDSYADKPQALKQDGNTPWLSEDKEPSRSLRGGSWLYDPRLCRSAFRLYASPDTRLNDYGFRVVCRAARALP
jgi:formylglycine-generating enzyme required for sulfatase activity